MRLDSAANGHSADGNDEPLVSPRLVEEIAHRVVELLLHEHSSGRRMLTAQQVADRYGLTRDWVYEHAEELGVIRIGDGCRPRLRFDPIKIALQLDVTERDPEPRPARRGRTSVDDSLLPIYGRATST